MMRAVLLSGAHKRLLSILRPIRHQNPKWEEDRTPGGEQETATNKSPTTVPVF